MDQQNIPTNALPNQDFVEMINRIEGSRDNTIQKVTEAPQTDMIMVDTPIGPVPFPKGATEQETINKSNKSIVENKQPEEIKLEYRYSGDCSKHCTQVSTLTAEVDGKCIVFAFCIECNKNVYSRVVPLIRHDDHEEHLKLFAEATQKRRTFTRKKKEVIV